MKHVYLQSSGKSKVKSLFRIVFVYLFIYLFVMSFFPKGTFYFACIFLHKQSLNNYFAVGR